MPQILNTESELIRINPRKKTIIEFSTNKGNSWMTCYSGTNNGEFIDLCDNGKEIIACTTKGIYYSTNHGRYWSCRYYNPGIGTSSIGKFQQILTNGPQLIATTTKGLYFSTNNGASWQKRS